MATEGAIGGSRDLNAVRGASTNLAATIDGMVRAATAFAAAFKDYGQDGFVTIGLDVDSAYWLAVEIQNMPGHLASADVQALVAFADRCRDITRIVTF